MRPFATAAMMMFTLAMPAYAATVWRRPATVPAFASRVPIELHRLADDEGSTRLNHFCAVVRTSPGDSNDSSTQLLIYWREGARISTYGEPYPDQKGLGYRDEGADINLRMDVVARESQINGSIKRVTRKYVDDIIENCVRNGTRYLIRRVRK